MGGEGLLEARAQSPGGARPGRRDLSRPGERVGGGWLGAGLTWRRGELVPAWEGRGRWSGLGVASFGVRGRLWALKSWVGGREGWGRAEAGVMWVGATREEDEPGVGSGGLGVAGEGRGGGLGEEEWGRKAAGSGAWSVRVNWVIQRYARLRAEQLARDAVRRSEVQVGLRCA